MYMPLYYTYLCCVHTFSFMWDCALSTSDRMSKQGKVYGFQVIFPDLHCVLIRPGQVRAKAARFRTWEPHFGASRCTLANVGDQLSRRTCVATSVFQCVCLCCRLCRWKVANVDKEKYKARVC